MSCVLIPEDPKEVVKIMPEQLPVTSGLRAPSVPYGFSLVIALLLVMVGLLLVAFNGDHPWLDDPASGIHRIEHMEQSALGPGLPNPKVVIWGSSRPSFGIMSRRLAHNLGYQASEGANLAFPALYDQKLITILDRNFSKVTQAKLWIIGIDDYFLLSSLPKPNPPQSPAENLENVVHAWLKPFVCLNKRGKWLFRHLSAIFGTYTLSSLPWKLTPEGNWEDEIEKRRVADPIREAHIFKAVAQSYMGDKILNPKLIKPYEQLIQIAQKHKIKVILVSLPYHPRYNQLIQQEYRTVFQLNRQAFQSLALKYHTPLMTCDDSQACGVTAQHFMDPVHLNYSGANRFTTFLSKKIQELPQ